MHRFNSLGGAALLATSIGLGACAVRAYPPTVGGYATVYADGVPADIYAYPHVSYEGSYAYLVGDRWYYPSGGGWVVLQDEPRELYRYRSTNVRRAPPAYGPGNEPREYAPPAQSQYGYPPPAVRVR
jgi:hypothetical protein